MAHGGCHGIIFHARCQCSTGLALDKQEIEICFSHDFQFLPIQDFENIACDQPIQNFFVGQKKKQMVPINSAVECLCRPEELEEMCSFDCFESHKGVNLSQSSAWNDTLLRFREADCEDSQEALIHHKRGLQVLDRKVVPIICQGFMMDSMKLEANILNPSETNNHALSCLHELHARRILQLFHPFRDTDDLKMNGRQIEKLQWAVACKKLHPEANSWLQNMQDCINSMRCAVCKRILWKGALLQERLMMRTTTMNEKKKKEKRNLMLSQT